jgi:hypothetical protein
MFGGPVTAIRRVDGTHIFARATRGGRQLLVYSMNVAARQPVAMILPLPVPPNPGEDALRFVDLKGYPAFFRDLDAAFPALEIEASRGGGTAVFGASQSLKLVVHEVGDFIASFVPSFADFERLDERFRLSDAVWDALPTYRDYGFAVFQLKDLGGQSWFRRLFARPTTKTIHPMAFEFPRRDADVLFFPTVHVHDGEVHEKAMFDHHLYAQLLPGQRPPPAWQENDTPLANHLDVERSEGVVDFDLPAFTRSVMGWHENADITVRPEPLGTAA